MGIKPYVEVEEESKQDAFEAALAIKEQEEEDGGREITLPEITDEEVEVVVGEPPEEESENKSSQDENVLGRLVDLLEKRDTPVVKEEVPKRAVIQPVDKEAVKKKFNEEFYKSEDPFSLVEESANALIGGTTAALSLEIQKLKKEVLKNDPINSMVFENWENEVEKAIAELPPAQQAHPDAYDYALKKVRDNHFTEILEAKVEEKLTKAKAKPGATATLGSSRSGVSSGPKKKRKKTVYATARDKAEAKRYGVSLNNYLKGIGKI